MERATQESGFADSGPHAGDSPEPPAGAWAQARAQLSHCVDAWIALPEMFSRPSDLQACTALLCAEEQARAARFRFERHRRTFVVAHALVRTALSSYAEVRPQEWRFATGKHGRPEIAQPAHADLRFNLSHTEGLAICAVTEQLDVGCDAEDTSRALVEMDLAQRYFSAAESRSLLPLTAGPRRLRFFEYWTLKEAYLKARGLGLRLPLDRFSFRVEDAGQVRVQFDPVLDDDAARWQFELLAPTARHVVAVALRHRQQAPRALRTRSAAPLLNLMKMR